MSIRQLASNQRTARYQITNQTTDLGDGINPIVPVQMSGINAGRTGYIDTASAYQAYALGDIILAEDTGTEWQVGLDDNDDKVIFVLNDTSSGASIVYVTAQPARYPGLSSPVFQTLPTALTNPAVVAAAAAGGVTLILLDDVYDVTAATPTIPPELRLFAFSAGGAIITSSAAAPTLFTGGNTKLENVSVTNTGGATAIQTVGNGTIEIAGAVSIAGIDSATNDHAINLQLRGGVTITGALLSGITGPLNITSNDSTVNAVTGATGSVTSHGGSYANIEFTGSANVTANDTTFFSIDTTGTIDLQSCRVTAAIGNTTLPTNTILRESQVSGGLNTLSAEIRGSTVSGPIGTLDLLLESSHAYGNVLSLGKCDVFFSSIGGSMTSSSGAFTSSQNIFNGPVSADEISDTGSQFLDTYTSTLVDSTFTGSYIFGVMTLAAGQDAELRNCFMRVPVGATGAIVNAGGAVVLIDSYVRADDTLISVSGTGTVSAQGHVGGGCTYAPTITAGATTSDVRGHSLLTADIAGPTNFATLVGSTEAIDVFVLNPTVVLPTVDLNAASIFPIGYTQLIKNTSLLNTIQIQSLGADTLDGLSATPVSIAPNAFIRVMKVSNTAWITC